MSKRSTLNLSSKQERTLADERTGVFRLLCHNAGLPEPHREYPFAKPDRQWRFDFAWPDRGIALEVEGGVYSRGRHVRPTGFLKDMEKYNAAAGRGWLVFRCTPKTLDSMATVEMVKCAYMAWTARGIGSP